MLRFVGYSVLGAALVAGFVTAVSGVGYVIRYGACEMMRMGGWMCVSSHTKLFEWGAVPILAALVCAAFGWVAVDFVRVKRRERQRR